MARFDAELYLRIAGEEMILGVGRQRHRPWGSPLLEPARALLAVDAISASRARAVIEDYTLAHALRAADSDHLQHQIAFAAAHPARRRRTTPLKPRRVIPCDRAIEDANGTLHVRHVSLSETSTSLAITWRPKPPAQGRSSRRGHLVMFGHSSYHPPSPQLTDDRGTTVGTGFSGGGSDEEWEGHLTADQPLALDTAWIEIDGTRLELSGEALTCQVSIEPLPEESAAHRYLWRLLATRDFHETPEIEGAIDALIAAGTLDPDDPALSEVRTVRDALPDHPGMYSGPIPGAGRLPEPWRSLLTRQLRRNGPDGTVVLSALTPKFEDFSVAVSSLESRAEGFGIEVDVAPGFERRGPFDTGLGPSPLIWWAGDDRGNHYLGQLTSSSGNEHYSTGTIEFWPALHRRARTLRIMPTAEETRAVISVPLPWAQNSAGSENQA